MADKYLSAKLKVERAKQQIAEFRALGARLSRSDYAVVVETNKATGDQRLQILNKPVPPEFGLVLGDVLTNLRAALDHCYAAVTGANQRTTGQTYFPIRDEPKSLVRKVEEALKEQTISQAVHDLIVNEIRPYQGGHPTIVALNKLANLDKHRVLVTTLSVNTFYADFRQGGVTVENTVIETSGEGPQPIPIRGRGPIEFKRQPQTSLDIRIGEREPSIFYNKSVVPTLVGLVRDVLQIIKRFEEVAP